MSHLHFLTATVAADAPQVSLHGSTRAVAVAVAIGFLLCVLELVRRHKLQERYTVVWFAAALAMLALAAFPQILSWVAGIVGITDTNAALFAIGFVIGGLMLLHLTVVVSRQSAQITRLAQENALLRSDQVSENPDTSTGSELQ